MPLGAFVFFVVLAAASVAFGYFVVNPVACF